MPLGTLALNFAISAMLRKIGRLVKFPRFPCHVPLRNSEGTTVIAFATHKFPLTVLSKLPTLEFCSISS